jgi:hypothetical protein
MGSAPWEEREVNDDEAVVMVSGGGYRPAVDGRSRVGSGGLGCPIPPYKGGWSAPTLGQTDLGGESEFYHTQTPAPPNRPREDSSSFLDAAGVGSMWPKAHGVPPRGFDLMENFVLLEYSRLFENKPI